jgi:hypothetical protein
MLPLPMPMVGGTPMFVAILGDRQSTLPANWTKETAIAIAAEAAFDAAAGAGPGASLTFVGVGGDLVLRVPSGSRVREGGFSLLGDRQIQVAGGHGPEIQVKVYGLFSDVKVTDQPA